MARIVWCAKKMSDSVWQRTKCEAFMIMSTMRKSSPKWTAQGFSGKNSSEYIKEKIARSYNDKSFVEY